MSRPKKNGASAATMRSRRQSSASTSSAASAGTPESPIVAMEHSVWKHSTSSVFQPSDARAAAMGGGSALLSAAGACRRMLMGVLLSP